METIHAMDVLLYVNLVIQRLLMLIQGLLLLGLESDYLYGKILIPT